MVACDNHGLSFSLYAYIPDVINTVIRYSYSTWSLNIYGNGMIYKIPDLISINFKKSIDSIIDSNSLATPRMGSPFKQIVFYENTV